MEKRTCFVFNLAPKYVEASYRLFDEKLNILWCFGSNKSDIKEMNHSLLKNVEIYKTIYLKHHAYYLKGILSLAFRKNINNYVLLGEPALLSMWALPRLIKLFHPSRKVYFWTHGWYGKETKIKAYIKKLFFAVADGILLYGNYAKNLMVQNGFDEKKLHVIHNSLNHTAQVALRNTIVGSSILSDHFNNTYPVLVVIGRLTERKNLQMLIEAVAALKTKGQNYNILFIGDGTAREKLEKLAESIILKDNVWFYGACYDEKTNAELLYNSDMCIVPGDIGLTAIHALVFGVPTVSHNFFKNQGPEFEAIKPGVTGDFFENNSLKSLIETISNWFNETNYNREAIRKACYSEVDNYWTPEFELNVLNQVLK
jgi:glycosyltransferase involved in cell wall biosynthesis